MQQNIKQINHFQKDQSQHTFKLQKTQLKNQSIDLQQQLPPVMSRSLMNLDINNYKNSIQEKNQFQAQEYDDLYKRIKNEQQDSISNKGKSFSAKLRQNQFRSLLEVKNGQQIGIKTSSLKGIKPDNLCNSQFLLKIVLFCSLFSIIIIMNYLLPIQPALQTQQLKAPVNSNIKNKLLFQVSSNNSATNRNQSTTIPKVLWTFQPKQNFIQLVKDPIPLKNSQQKKYGLNELLNDYLEIKNTNTLLRQYQQSSGFSQKQSKESNTSTIIKPLIINKNILINYKLLSNQQLNTIKSTIKNKLKSIAAKQENNNDQVKINNLIQMHIRNLIKLTLLKKYGGVWINHEDYHPIMTKVKVNENNIKNNTGQQALDNQQQEQGLQYQSSSLYQQILNLWDPISNKNQKITDHNYDLFNFWGTSPQIFMFHSQNGAVRNKNKTFVNSFNKQTQSEVKQCWNLKYMPEVTVVAVAQAKIIDEWINDYLQNIELSQQQLVKKYRYECIFPDKDALKQAKKPLRQHQNDQFLRQQNLLSTSLQCILSTRQVKLNQQAGNLKNYIDFISSQRYYKLWSSPLQLVQNDQKTENVNTQTEIIQNLVYELYPLLEQKQETDYNKGQNEEKIQDENQKNQINIEQRQQNLQQNQGVQKEQKQEEQQEQTQTQQQQLIRFLTQNSNTKFYKIGKNKNKKIQKIFPQKEFLDNKNKQQESQDDSYDFIAFNSQQTKIAQNNKQNNQKHRILSTMNQTKNSSKKISSTQAKNKKPKKKIFQVHSPQEKLARNQKLQENLIQKLLFKISQQRNLYQFQRQKQEVKKYYDSIIDGIMKQKQQIKSMRQQQVQKMKEYQKPKIYERIPKIAFIWVEKNNIQAVQKILKQQVKPIQKPKPYKQKITDQTKQFTTSSQILLSQLNLKNTIYNLNQFGIKSQSIYAINLQNWQKVESQLISKQKSINSSKKLKKQQLKQLLSYIDKNFNKNNSKLNNMSLQELSEKVKIIKQKIIMIYLLYNYGGISIDQDVIISRNLQWLKNIQSDKFVNTGINFNQEQNVLKNVPSFTIGFYVPDFSSLRKNFGNMMKKEFKVESDLVQYPAIDTEFVASEGNSQFLYNSFYKLSQIIRQDNSNKLDVLRSYLTQEKAGKLSKVNFDQPIDILQYGDKIAYHLVLRQKQQQIEQKMKKYQKEGNNIVRSQQQKAIISLINNENSEQNLNFSFAIDFYGLLTLNYNLGSHKLATFFRYQPQLNNTAQKLPIKVMFNQMSHMSLSQFEYHIGPLYYIYKIPNMKFVNEKLEKILKEQQNQQNSFFYYQSFLWQYFFKYYQKSQELSFIRRNPQKAVVSPYEQPWKELPKILWVVWYEGIQKGTIMNQLCFKNLVKSAQNSGFQVNLVDKYNLHQYIDQQTNLNIQNVIKNTTYAIGLQQLTDSWRLAFLAKKGGIYMDMGYFLTHQSFDWLENIKRLPSNFIWNHHGQSPSTVMLFHTYDGWPGEWEFNSQINSKSQWHLSYQNNFIATVPNNPLIQQWLDQFLYWHKLTYEQTAKIMSQSGIFEYKWTSKQTRYLTAMQTIKAIIGRKQKQLQQKSIAELESNQNNPNSFSNQIPRQDLASQYYKIWSFSGFTGQQKFRLQTNYLNKDYRLSQDQNDYHNLFLDKYSKESQQKILGNQVYVSKFYGWQGKIINRVVQKQFKNNFTQKIHPQSILMNTFLKKQYTEQVFNNKFITLTNLVGYY